MDFLLECLGFPPQQDPRELAELVRRRGESVAWRGPAGEHMRLRLGGGLELRLDCEAEGEPVEVLPYFEAPQRLRIAVESLRRSPDSPSDVLLTGWVGPPAPGLELAHEEPGAYQIATWVTDGRRLPREIERGHVLAVSIAGFGLDVAYVGPNEGGKTPGVLERPRGASIEPLGGVESPGGCAELSVRVRALRHLANPLTKRPVDLLEVDAPERPLYLFVSPWQLRDAGLAAPRPGWRIEGSFLFNGRVAGGLPGPHQRVRSAFG